MKQRKKINELCKAIIMNSKCDLHDGKPCNTCRFGIIRDIERLEIELKNLGIKRE